MELVGNGIIWPVGSLSHSKLVVQHLEFDILGIPHSPGTTNEDLLSSCHEAQEGASILIWTRISVPQISLMAKSAVKLQLEASLPRNCA